MYFFMFIIPFVSVEMGDLYKNKYFVSSIIISLSLIFQWNSKWSKIIEWINQRLYEWVDAWGYPGH